jgi:hypothetical protein
MFKQDYTILDQLPVTSSGVLRYGVCHLDLSDKVVKLEKQQVLLAKIYVKATTPISGKAARLPRKR